MRGDAVEPAGAASRRAERGTAWEHNPVADLRPVSGGAVLDGGFELLRFRFGRLIALTACLYLPIWLCSVVLAIVSPPEVSTADSAGGSGIAWSAVTMGSSSSLVVVLVGAQVVALSILGLCTGHLVMGLARGEDPSLRELGSVALRRWWVALLIVPMNAGVHLVSSCLSGIGWVLGDALVFLSSVAAGAEALGPWKGFRRSWDLTRPQFGRALGISFGGLCIAQVIRWSLSWGPTALILSLDPASPLVGLFTALSSAVLLITEPLTACIAARAYLDLRCRRDGVDLVLRQQRMVDEHRPRHEQAVLR